MAKNITDIPALIQASNREDKALVRQKLRKQWPSTCRNLNPPSTKEISNSKKSSWHWIISTKKNTKLIEESNKQAIVSKPFTTMEISHKILKNLKGVREPSKNNSRKIYWRNYNRQWGGKILTFFASENEGIHRELQRNHQKI